MTTIQSPQFCNAHNIELLHKLSPSFRNKRIPSAQDNFSCCSNQNLKLSKTQSPSKYSEKLRRKSQHHRNKKNNNNNKSITQNILTQMLYLKEQYRTLKDAYTQLINERIKSTSDIKQIKKQNIDIKHTLQQITLQNQKLKAKKSFQDQEIQRLKKQCYKLVEIQKFRAKKLEQTLFEKEQWIKRMLVSRVEEGEGRKEPTIQSKKDESLVLSHDKTMENQSQFFSISLTSMMQESQDRHELNTKRQMIQNNIIDQQVGKMHNKAEYYKSFRKEIAKKLQINLQVKPKQNCITNLLPKTPSINERKNKSKNISSKKKEINEKQNYEWKSKKKLRKIN